MSNTCYKKDPNESITDYAVRLYDGKNLYGLSHYGIAELLNAESGLQRNEATWRKEYAAFNRGREYERKRILGGALVDTRILSISDAHVPFNLNIDLLKDYAGFVDVLVLNGDIQDCQSISKWSRKYRVPFIDEMIAARKFITNVIDLLRPQKVLITKGNHEVRLIKYLSDRINEDVMSLMPDTPLDLIVNEGFKNRDRQNGTEIWYKPLKEVYSEQGIEIDYSGKWWVKVGKTIFAHPQAYSTGMLKTTEKAINYFLREDREFNALVMAHTHAFGSFVQGGIRMYEQGCFCDLSKLDYADGRLTFPNQNGFILVAQNVDGDIMPEETRLISI